MLDYIEYIKMLHEIEMEGQTRVEILTEINAVFQMKKTERMVKL